MCGVVGLTITCKFKIGAWEFDSIHGCVWSGIFLWGLINAPSLKGNQ